MAARKQYSIGPLIGLVGIVMCSYGADMGSTVLVVIGAAFLVIAHQTAHHRELVQIRKALERLYEESD